MDEKLKPFMAGFDLSGFRRGGEIYPCSGGEPLDDWPQTVELFGVTYTLETIMKGAVDERGQFQSALYV